MCSNYDRKAELIKQHGKDENRSQVQVALLTERIRQLTDYYVVPPEGLSHLSWSSDARWCCRRLSCIKSNDIEEYRTLIASPGYPRQHPVLVF